MDWVVVAGIEPAPGREPDQHQMQHNEESTDGTVGLCKLRQLDHRQCSFRCVPRLCLASAFNLWLPKSILMHGEAN